MVAAVHLRVAVLARASDHARALPATEKRAGGRLSITVERAVVPDGQVVALLAQIRPRGDEELVVIGAVWLVTADAVLTDRRVFPQHRPAFLGVT